jgi:hypothetical protein
MKHVIVALAVTMLAGAGIARADSVTITSGTVELDLQSGGATTAVLVGPETVITGFGTNPATIDFNAGGVGSIGPSTLSIGAGGSLPATAQFIGGVMFPASDHLQGSLVLTTSPFNAAAGTDPLAFFQTPFTMTGNASVLNSSGTVVGTTSLSGSGEATVIAQTTSGAATGFNTQHVSFQFGTASATATPEPATLVLLGAALAGGLLGRRWFSTASL